MATRGGRRRSRSPYRQARAGLYGLTRTMGNLQPFVDFLGNGDAGALVGNVLRRSGRRVVGRAFAHYSFGGNGFGSVAAEILLILLGRLIGYRGRR